MPTASLYRHIARLVARGVLSVVAERRVRGAVERTYVMRVAAAGIGADQVAAMSTDEHRQAFLALVAGLIGDAERYLARDDVNPIRDGASYHLAGLWLSDAELTDFARDLDLVVQPRLANGPRRGRSRRILATALLPAGDPPPPVRSTGRKGTPQ